MGYLSSFEIYVKYPKEYDKYASAINTEFPLYFRKKLKEISGYDFEIIGKNPFSLNPGDMVKWYKCVEDLTEISALFTGCEIECSVYGEGGDDFQEHIFKDGRCATSIGEINYWTYDQDKEDREKVLTSNIGPRPKAFLPLEP